jgi:hypothetical protein
VPGVIVDATIVAGARPISGGLLGAHREALSDEMLSSVGSGSPCPPVVASGYQVGDICDRVRGLYIRWWRFRVTLRLERQRGRRPSLTAALSFWRRREA